MRSRSYQWLERMICVRQKRNSIMFAVAAVVIFILTGVATATSSYARDLETRPYQDPRAIVVPVYQPGDQNPIAYYVSGADGNKMMCTREVDESIYICVGKY